MVSENTNKTPRTSGDMRSGPNTGCRFLFQVGSGENTPDG